MINKEIAILGAGTIGASWAALFAATGRNVTVYDPSSLAQHKVLEMVQSAATALAALGWEQAGDVSRIHFTDDVCDAVSCADFIQESIAERLDIKHGLYRQMEPFLKPDVIIGTSTSGLLLSELQQGFSNPSRMILAHPFNPPHLMPLVELMENEQTDPGVLDQTRAFYESLGKVCVTLNTEIPGHIANRLQAALWRETIHLAIEGVASVEDIDKAVAHGPGLRWGIYGPNALFHLGGGEAGLRGFCKHLGLSFESWWNDLGTPNLSNEVVEKIASAVDRSDIASSAEAEKRRDELLLAFILRKSAT